MTSLLGYLLAILAAALLYGLTWRNRLIRDPVTGRTRAWWLSTEAKTLIDQLRLREGRLPELPRWHGPMPRWGVLVIRIDPPRGIADAAVSASITNAAPAAIGSSSVVVSWEG